MFQDDRPAVDAERCRLVQQRLDGARQDGEKRQKVGRADGDDGPGDEEVVDLDGGKQASVKWKSKNAKRRRSCFEMLISADAECLHRRLSNNREE